MSRQIRLEYSGALWHITTRSNERSKMFRDDSDRQLLLELLGKTVSKSDWILTAYALMPDHFQLLIRLTSATLASGMRWLNSQYAQRFNRRHDRVGHLVHGRYRGVLVEEETYFKEVLRHVVLNPVRTGLALKPDQYPWSSHLAVVGDVVAPKWLAVSSVLEHFDGRPERYFDFVNAGIGSDRRPWDDIVGQIYLGSERWLGDVRKRLAMKPRANEHPRLQRTPCTLDMRDVIGAVADAWSIGEGHICDARGGVPRMVAAWIGRYETFSTHRDIAASLRLRSAGRVASLIKQCDQALDDSLRLRVFVDRAVSTLRRKM
jgi:putative transposase